MSDLFISHSWKDKQTAFRIEADLGRQGVAVWVDHAELRAGEVLIDELQKAIEASRRLALLWSEDASRSRWVKTEWQAAFLLEKTIVPCHLDGTDLPLFLRLLLSCSFHTSYEKGLDELLAAVRAPVPDHGPVRSPAAVPVAVPAPESPAPRAPSAEPTPPSLVQQIYEGQTRMLDELGQDRLAAARRLQVRIEPLVVQAVRDSPTDALVFSLAGYHKKNAYMLRHWKELQAGSHPDDPLLAEAEALFHQSLDIRPDDLSAYNGLGSIFMLRGDLDAAEFFVGRALEQARADGTPYPSAEDDMRMIRTLKAARAGQKPAGTPEGATRTRRPRR
jgi:tetratricopeptide (TPR) repeat protein